MVKDAKPTAQEDLYAGLNLYHHRPSPSSLSPSPTTSVSSLAFFSVPSFVDFVFSNHIIANRQPYHVDEKDDSIFFAHAGAAVKAGFSCRSTFWCSSIIIARKRAAICSTGGGVHTP